ncbi:MAG: hypothetical protein ABFS19_13560 [Thermodesulfobacteriota bacterium]
MQNKIHIQVHYPLVTTIKELWKTATLLCRAKPEVLCSWFDRETEKIRLCLLLILVCGALYGMTLGVWRSPLQAVYVAVKFPLLIVLTMLGTGLINGMLAQLLGIAISFRQSLLAVLMSFALLSLILASFSPLLLFLVYNLPPMGSEGAGAGHRVLLLVNVAIITLSGLLANIHLYTLLVHICRTSSTALQLLFTWLTVNMFLGCQLSWNLRPFFGSPALPVRFLRDDPFAHSFYEAIYRMLF